MESAPTNDATWITLQVGPVDSVAGPFDRPAPATDSFPPRHLAPKEWNQMAIPGVYTPGRT